MEEGNGEAAMRKWNVINFCLHNFMIYALQPANSPSDIYFFVSQLYEPLFYINQAFLFIMKPQ